VRKNKRLEHLRNSVLSENALDGMGKQAWFRQMLILS